MGKSDFSALIGKAKEKQIKTPVQKVVPIKEKKEETFGIWIKSCKPQHNQNLNSNKANRSID